MPSQTNRCFYIDAGVTINGFTITNGFAYGNYPDCLGGGVYCINSVVQDSTISRNSAPNGGGIYCYKSTVQFCVIRENIAFDTFNIGKRGHGGGIHSYDEGIVQNCTIIRNTAKSGGGVYSLFGNMKLLNNKINENFASSNGGGAHIKEAIIQNCTISANTANNSGGVFCWEFSTIQNSILWNNTNNNYFSSDSTNMYNCIENWTNLINGIITNNPEFRDAANGDYRLESYSPCRNTGTNMNWMWTATDLDDNLRIIDDIVDMGAYEYIPEL